MMRSIARGKPRRSAAVARRAEQLRIGRALAAALLAGCGPAADDAPSFPDDLVAQYAQARCGAMFRCGCAPSGWIDVAMCTAQMHAQYDARAEALAMTGVGVDAACLADVLAFWRSDAACDDPRVASPVPYCALVGGQGELDEPCASMTTYSFAASSCGSGLHCRDGSVCDDPPVGIELAAGQACLAAAFACADGLYCDEGTGVCAPRLAAGAACAQAAACDETSWCAGIEVATPGVCETRAGQGEACTGTSWDPRPCAPEIEGGRSFAHHCVDGVCTGAVPAACGTWL